VGGFGDRFATVCLRRLRRDIVPSNINLVLSFITVSHGSI
jgi:hypothetical protein